MNPDHFALVIGLASYPKLGDPPPGDLKAPENDADAVVEWLVRANGGGLPRENVHQICSRDQKSPPEAAPTRDDLEKAFLWLDGLATSNLAAGKGRKVGKRLYLYVSGHGFSPRFRDGCLLAGNAAEKQFSANIFPSAWLDWLRDADYFKEYILWMDCCMDRVVLTAPTPPPLDPIGGGGSGKTFIAFAATRPLKAAEKELPPGTNTWHSVFTWNLLQGLGGAAADEHGMVTSASLADWLRQAQLGWLDNTDRANATIAKEPAIIQKDDGIIFAKNVAPMTFDVTLRIPNATTGSQITLWSGSPPTQGAPITIAPEGSKLQLAPGLYVAEGNGLRHGFAVTHPTTLDLTEQGPPVTPSAGKFTLQVDPGDASAAITLFESKFGVVMCDNAQLLPPPLDFGLYEVRITVGRQIVEKVILLDRDWPPPAQTAAAIPQAMGAAEAVAAGPGAPPPPAPKQPAANVLPEMPQITSAAPLPGTRATSEHQQANVATALENTGTAVGYDIKAGEGADLMIMARWSAAGQGVKPGRMPWQDVRLRDSTGALVADLSTAGRHDAGKDASGVCTFSLSPGAYELRFPVGVNGRLRQSLILPPGGWRLEAYVMYKSSDMGARPAVSLLMRKTGSAWGTDEDIQLQKAIVALADERPIFNQQLSDALFGKLGNPLAGIVGAHLLLISVREQSSNEAEAALAPLNEMVTNLRTLVGREHPDVEALSLKCPDPALHTTASIQAPPMFDASWRILLEASQSRPDLITSTLWQKVHASAGVPPYLVWTTDEDTQTGYREALAKSIFTSRAPPASDAGKTASRLRRQSSDQPQTSSAAVSEAEIARRAHALGLPPSAIELLRKDFQSSSAAAPGDQMQGSSAQ